MIPYTLTVEAEGEPPREWSVPSVVMYIAARDERSDKATFVRNLNTASRRAGLDRVEARMVLSSDTGKPGREGVCPGFIWLAGQARRAPRPRLLYFSDLVCDRSGFAKTLQVLFDADFSVRVCDGLLSAADRSLHPFRASSDALASAPATRADRLSTARQLGECGSCGGTRVRPTMEGEA